VTQHYDEYSKKISPDLRVWVSELSEFEDEIEKLKDTDPFVSKFENLKRRREFLHGRLLLRSGIQSLTGSDPGWMIPRQYGPPPLPAGVSGSLTHSGPYAAVALLPSQSETKVGIDLEVPMTEAQAEKILGQIQKRSVKITGSLERYFSCPREQAQAGFSVFEALQKTLPQFSILNRVSEFTFELNENLFHARCLDYHWKGFITLKPDYALAIAILTQRVIQP